MFGHHHPHRWRGHGGGACRSPEGFGRGRHGGWGQWDHGGPRRRVFDQGDLRLVVLQLIAEQPRHGYDLIKAIEEKLGGAYAPSPGVIYPTLTLLEDMGLIAAQPGDGAKKAFAITEEGRKRLDENRSALDALAARMSEVRARSQGASPQIVRAMENLRTALRLKLGQGELSEAEVRRIVEQLDAATVAIERA